MNVLKELEERTLKEGQEWTRRLLEKRTQAEADRVEDRLVFTATTTNLYQRASKVATRWGMSVSDDAIHAVVQRVGERVPTGTLPPPPPRPAKKFSLVTMMDG